MAKKRVTRKQLLKEPDEFITTTGKIISWARENAQSLKIGSAVFFGLIIAVSIYGYIHQNRSSTAQMMFSQAVSKYQTEAEQKSEQEALSAVRTDLDAMLESYGNLPAGQMARIFYGHISLAGKDYEQAIAQYQKALDDFSGEPSLIHIILHGLATAYQQKGELSRAVEYFRKIADGSDILLKDVALFNLGKLYAQLEKPEESEKAYKELNSDFPDSMYADIVREKISG